MEGEVVKKNRITEGSIFGQLLLFFFPILFGTFSSSFIIRRMPWWWAALWKAGPGRSGRKHQHPD